MDKRFVKTGSGKDIDVKELLIDRIEIIVRKAHEGMRRKYSGVPLWSFISELTGHGSTYSSYICEYLGLDPNQDASKKL